MTEHDEDEAVRSMTKRPKKWAQAATKRMEEKGTVGSLTRMAHEAGESTSEFAHSHYNSPGLVGKKSRFDVNLNG